MISTVQAGQSVLGRMSLYRRLAGLGPLRASYAGKFALAACVGILLPLASFIVFLLVARADVSAIYPALAALFLACFMGFLGTLWIVRELLVPIDLTAEALRDYIEKRQLPDLPVAFPDRAGRLMEGTQYTLAQLHETIDRLERVSDTDDLTGTYNRRAGDKRLSEEVARAERDLETFHIAVFDINAFKQVNDTHGHSAGDACISHVATLLQRNTRRGDWVARWGADEFVMGLHRTRALKRVIERLVDLISATPCEIAPGVEVPIHVSCGVAEYRFGTGPAGVLADMDKAVDAAKQAALAGGGSQIRYRHEMPEVASEATERTIAS